MSYTIKAISRNHGPWSDPPQILTLSAPFVDTEAAGWDIMRETLLVPYTPFFKAGERRDHVLDPKVQPFAHMVVQSERTLGHHAGFPVIELTSWGLAREKPWKCTTTGASQGTIGSGSGVTRGIPTVTCYWFSLSLEGTKLYVPWSAVPPETFGWVDWAGTTGGDPVYGWYIIRRDVDPLPVMCGANAQVVKGASYLGGGIRGDANAAPRPQLCSVIDYYAYDPINTLPPND